MKALLREIARRLAGGESVVAATIVRASGSSPRTGGAKMLVRADGSSAGSVGGGRLEAETLELAAEAFRTRRPRLQPFELTGADAAEAAMLCGGHGEILVDLLDAAEPGTVAAFTAAAGALARREPAWLLTALDPPAGAPAAGRHGLLRRDAAGVGAVPEQAAAWTRGPEAHGIRVETAGGRRVLVEPLPRAGRVLVFGAGHCAQRLAPLAASVGFEVAVLDDRAEFLRPALFPAEVEQVPLASFERLPELGIDEDTYVVIVTRGHLHDLVVLEQCLRTRAGYLGMIGSVRKRDKVYAALRARGAVPAGLERVHSPIGVDIDAETPEEIAVSIVGELILARAAQRRSSRT